MRLRFFSGNRRHASRMSCSEYFLVGGTIAARCSSVRRVQRDRQVRHQLLLRQLVEHRHEADRRQRDAPRAHRQAVLVVEDPQRLHRRVVVVQRLAHAHQHDVERRSCRSRARARGRAPGRRSRRRVRWRIRPILPVRQKAQPIAQPTCVEMQKVCAGVSGMKTDSICLPSARREHELLRAVFGDVAPDDRRCARSTNSSASCARSARLRSVMRAKSVTPRFQIQRKTWRAWKRGIAALVEQRFELGQLQVRSGRPACAPHDACTHDIIHL